MKKPIKYTVWIVGALILMVILAALIIPLFIDVAQYKPMIEKKVSDATGRPFSIGGKLSLVLLPSPALSFSDLRLGNPPGFGQEPLVRISDLDVKIELIPLISGNIEVERFRVDGLRLALEKDAAGRGNWQGLNGAGGTGAGSAGRAAPRSERSGAWSYLASLSIKALSITDGAVMWADAGSGRHHELSGLRLSIKDFSLARPVAVEFSGEFDGSAFSVDGKVGPFGSHPDIEVLPVDLTLTLLDQARISLNGSLRGPARNLSYDFRLALEPFSPRRLMQAAGSGLAYRPADPDALGKLSLQAGLSGGPDRVALTDGHIQLDDSQIDLTAAVSDFSRPDVAVDVAIDRIDLDRYLPQGKKGAASEAQPTAAAPANTAPPALDICVRPRPLVLDVSLKVGDLTARGVALEKVESKLSGRNGSFELKPVVANLYGGNLDGAVFVDCGKSGPVSRIDLNLRGIQAEPLAMALLQKDIIEGTLQGKAALSMSGDRPEEIRKTLDGSIDVALRDGTIKGIDLAAMVQAAEKAFDIAMYQGGERRTAFSEIRAPFHLTRGVATTDNTTLTSPLLTASASGKADLSKETLDFRILPRMAYKERKNGRETATEIRLPLILSGTFSSPVLTPDLSAIASDQLEKRVFESKGFKEAFKKDELKPLEGAAKGLLRGLLSR